MDRVKGEGGTHIARPVLVLTGGPAVGKTATARFLAERLDRCAVIDVDDLRHFVVSGHAAPWEGEPGGRQRELGVRNACGLARSFTDERFPVVIADVLTPSTAALCRVLLADLQIVHLTVASEEARRRSSLRVEHLSRQEFDDLHAAQEVEPPSADLTLDVTRMSLAEQVGAVWEFWTASPVPRPPRSSEASGSGC